jgi:DNA-binding CsgD family transcriptional regulator
MCLHREAGAAGFSQQDRDIVAKIAPHVAEGFRGALLAEHATDEGPRWAGAQAKVVSLVLSGYSTKQIVSQLAISQYTVQEHLKAVFDKLGVRSRQELAAALLWPGR